MHLEWLNTPVLTVVNVHISSKLREIGMSQSASRSIKRVSIPMLISVKSDLNVDIARVLPDEGEIGDGLPHVKCLVHCSVNISIAQAARGGILQNPDNITRLQGAHIAPSPTCMTAAWPATCSPGEHRLRSGPSSRGPCPGSSCPWPRTWGSPSAPQWLGPAPQWHRDQQTPGILWHHPKRECHFMVTKSLQINHIQSMIKAIDHLDKFLDVVLSDQCLCPRILGNVSIFWEVDQSPCLLLATADSPWQHQQH